MDRVGLERFFAERCGSGESAIKAAYPQWVVVAEQNRVAAISLDHSRYIGGALLQHSPCWRILPLSPFCSSDPLDLGGAACVETVHECYADMDFGGLSVGVS